VVGRRCATTAIVILSGLLAAAPAACASDEELWGSPKPGWDYYQSYDYGDWAVISPPTADADTQTRPPAWSNGGSDHTTFSQDNRDVRLVAFDSEASNLVAGDLNGRRDVFVMRRSRGGGNMAGALSVVSVRTNGAPANGPSSSPALDGQTRVPPHCVVFESQATNLDRRDRAPDPDVYIRDLRARTTRLVSRNVLAATAPVVDGRCGVVSFEAAGSVWLAHLRSGRIFRVAKGADHDMQTNGRGTAYVRGGQVWYRSLAFDGSGARLHRGRERLVSAAPRGRRGDGPSGNPALDDRGYYVAFESRASNLCGTRCARVRGVVPGNVQPNDRVTGIYRRTLEPRRAPTHDTMELVFHAPGLGQNAVDPAISAAGENVNFAIQSQGELWYMDPGYKPVRVPASTLASWSFPRRRGYGGVKLLKRRGCYPNACLSGVKHVSMSARGNYVAFTTTMPEFCAPRRPRGWIGDRDCHAYTDVFMRFMGWSHEGFPLG
jgi:hypothetical protein